MPARDVPTPDTNKDKKSTKPTTRTLQHHLQTKPERTITHSFGWNSGTWTGYHNHVRATPSSATEAPCRMPSPFSSFLQQYKQCIEGKEPFNNTDLWTMEREGGHSVSNVLNSELGVHRACVDIVDDGRGMLVYVR